MSWTAWRKLADRKHWYSGELDHDGACCYELGTGGPRGAKIQIHYVGETGCEKERMSQYGRDGSHLSKIINSHLKEGWCIFYRAFLLPSKAAAVKMQERMLKNFKYDWNDKLNRD